MNIIIIEDENNKMQQIISVINEIIDNPTYITCKSLNSGLRNIRSSENLDIAIIDMSLPAFDVDNNEDGGRPRTFGGKEIFRYMERIEKFIPSIVITQFDKFGHGPNEVTLEILKNELNNEYFSSLLGIVYYDSRFETWKLELKQILSEVVKS